MLEMFTIRPDPAARIPGSAACAHTNAASTLTRCTSCHSAIEYSPTALLGYIAALFTSTLTPSLATTPAITAAVRSRSARSHGTKRALPGGALWLICSATISPGLAGRSTSTTRPPSAANAAAMTDPSPPAAPVMMIVAPAKRIESPSAFPRPSTLGGVGARQRRADAMHRSFRIGVLELTQAVVRIVGIFELARHACLRPCGVQRVRIRHIQIHQAAGTALGPPVPPVQVHRHRPAVDEPVVARPGIQFHLEAQAAITLHRRVEVAHGDDGGNALEHNFRLHDGHRSLEVPRGLIPALPHRPRLTPASGERLSGAGAVQRRTERLSGGG